MKLYHALLLGASLWFSSLTSQAQLLNKLKQRTEDKALDKLFGGKDNKKDAQSTTNQGSTNGTGGSGTTSGNNLICLGNFQNDRSD